MFSLANVYSLLFAIHVSLTHRALVSVKQYKPNTVIIISLENCQTSNT